MGWLYYGRSRSAATRDEIALFRMGLRVISCIKRVLDRIRLVKRRSWTRRDASALYGHQSCRRLAMDAAATAGKRKRDSGYEKMGKVNGRPVHERFSRSGPEGEYGTLVGGRFLVEARGHKVDMEALRQAVAALDLSKLESLKNEDHQ